MQKILALNLTPLFSIIKLGRLLISHSDCLQMLQLPYWHLYCYMRFLRLIPLEIMTFTFGILNIVETKQGKAVFWTWLTQPLPKEDSRASGS